MIVSEPELICFDGCAAAESVGRSETIVFTFVSSG
jgi:hypothetical protein